MRPITTNAQPLTPSEIMSALLCPDAFLSPLEIDEVVTRALTEDLGRAGDVTSTATIPDTAQARAIVVARQAGTIAGLPMVAAAFRKLAPEIEIKPHARDGVQVAAKTALMHVTGPARAVLAAERVALNLLGSLSGVATATHEFVRRIKESRTRICCTRKTTPGLRSFQKYAVRCGGGHNHRLDLSDGVLIKNNHIAMAGGVAQALERAHRNRRGEQPIEIEVRTMAELEDALQHGGEALLLDNMTPDLVRACVERASSHSRRIPLEASGGINLENVRLYAETGVDYISVGSLTHSPKAVDLSLRIVPA